MSEVEQLKLPLRSNTTVEHDLRETAAFKERNTQISRINVLADIYEVCSRSQQAILSDGGRGEHSIRLLPGVSMMKDVY